MRKVLVACILLFVCLNSFAFASNNITMYTLDGRTAYVPVEDVEAWGKVGWYTCPVITMYALDGRSAVVPASDAEAWGKVGWYTCPVITMYALDGRSTVVPASDVEAWRRVGWYTEKPSLSLPISGPQEFCFTSGAGAWSTNITVYPDGSFYGDFHDSDMGSTGYRHPNGTVYTCEFSGKFGNIQVLDEYSYSMSLEYISIDVPEGMEWISEGILYVASGPYGLENGRDYIFYKKNTPAYRLPYDFKEWWMDFRYGNPKPSALIGYGIYNITEGYGFFS